MHPLQNLRALRAPPIQSIHITKTPTQKRNFLDGTLIECAYAVQANFVFIHDGGGCLLNASVKFVLGEVGDGSLIQQYSVEFVKVVYMNTAISC